MLHLVPTSVVLVIFNVLSYYSYAEYSSSYYTQLKTNEEERLKGDLQSHPDVINDYYPDRERDKIYNRYRISYPDEEDYIISLLVNPCGANGTHGDLDESIPLGYDCCMHQFGRGEYGFMKYHESYENGMLPMSTLEALEHRIPANPNEVLHNMILVDEYGDEIEIKNSRRSDDFTIIDESCMEFRDPHPNCVSSRLRAKRSPYVSSCWDHNQTVDATLSCYTPNGFKSTNCMQISYAQNAYIFTCGGNAANDPKCGTYIEIHQPNGSLYYSEDVTLAESKVDVVETNGMVTSTIPLNFKGDKKKILCAYSESKMRIGSIVRIKSVSPTCCCPPPYNILTSTGSFFCPRKPRTKNGPFADAVDTIPERFERDIDQEVYPYCHHDRLNGNDEIMCSRDIASDWNIDDETKDILFGPETFFYTSPCYALMKTDLNTYTSADLQGYYENVCPLGSVFKSCGLSNNGECFSTDSKYSFAGNTGKVVTIPSESEGTYGVTFNDGRTVYNFPHHHLELVNPESNYELWFVQRNRFEKILQKKKGFRVIWPPCTFDPINDQYYPFAVFDDSGNILDIWSMNK